MKQGPATGTAVSGVILRVWVLMARAPCSSACSRRGGVNELQQPFLQGLRASVAVIGPCGSPSQAAQHVG